jgi:hypothetical protein
LIDPNVSLGHWPKRRSWVESIAQLGAKLRSHGAKTLWTSSFDAALRTDVAGLNSRLAEDRAHNGGVDWDLGICAIGAQPDAYADPGGGDPVYGEVGPCVNSVRTASATAAMLPGAASTPKSAAS